MDRSDPGSSSPRLEPQPAAESPTTANAEEKTTVQDVTVPEGVSGGDTITVELPDGRELDVDIPEGLVAGDEFEVEPLAIAESVHVKTRRKTEYLVTFWEFLSFATR